MSVFTLKNWNRRAERFWGLTQLESRINPAPYVVSTLRLDASPTNALSVRYEVTFTEAVTGFDITDLAVSGTASAGASVASLSGSGAKYIATVNTPIAAGLLRLDINDDDTIVGTANVPLGGVGIGNGKYTFGPSYTLDRVGPTTTVSSPNPWTVLGEFPVTVTFSETVVGFDANDVAVTNGILSGFAGSGSQYSMTVTPLARGDVSIMVAAGAAADSLGNLSSNWSVLQRNHNFATGEQPVNATTVGLQWSGTSNRTIACDPDGNSLIVWQGVGPGDADGIFAQRFDARGNKLGGEFRVNTTTAKKQDTPTVAVSPAGAVVVWASLDQDGSGYGIFAQRYDAAGSPAGIEFQVNVTTTGAQTRPTVAMDGDGDLFIAWANDSAGGSGLDVFGRRYDGTGAPTGGEFLINTTTTNWQYLPSVSMNAGGECVVVWESYQIGSGIDVFGQRYDSAGIALGGEFRVNTFTTFGQQTPAVAVDAAGNAIVVWQSDPHEDPWTGIYGQRYDATGAMVGEEFAISSTEPFNRTAPSVAVNAAGETVVTWISKNQDGSLDGVFGKWFAANGAEVGGEFQVNTFTSNTQNYASAAISASGDFVVAWTSNAQDGSGSGVIARRVASPVAGKAAPSVTSILRADSNPTRAGTVHFAVNFSEPVIGVDVSDFSLFENGLPGKAIAGVTGSGAEYLVTVTTGVGSGPLRLDLIDNKTIKNLAGDSLGGAGVGDGSLTHGQQFSIDRIAPEINLTSDAPGTVVDPFLVFGEVSESVIGFDLSDVAVTNGSVSKLSLFGLKYSFLVTPSGAGTVSVSCPASGFTDLAGNGNVASNAVTRMAMAATAETRVNTTTAGRQTARSLRNVTSDSRGRVLTVWSYGGVFGQWFDATGQKIGTEFLISGNTAFTESYPAVAASESGGFAVVWRGYNSSDPSGGVFAQRYSATGSKIGSEILVNSTTTGSQTYPTVAMDAEGRMVVAWMSGGQGGDLDGVFGQQFDSAGHKLGKEFKVNSATVGSQYWPCVATNVLGGFVVAWTSDTADIVAQRFGRDGIPVGSEFRVNSTTVGTDLFPSVASDAIGNFMVVWQRNTTSDWDVFGQRFDVAGMKVGPEIQINTTTTNHQQYPSVALDASGNAIVVWEGYAQFSNYFDVFGQRFDNSGNRIGTEFRVNATTYNTQDFTTVAVDADGDAFVVWESYDQDGSAEGVYGRRIASPTPDVVAPGVRGFIVNDGTTQRSRVTSVTVEFTERVAITPGTFRLVRTGPGGVSSPVTLVVDTSGSTAIRTVARLSFAGPQTQFGSLIDGLYSLSVEGGKFEDFSGNAGQGSAYLFHRLFGDSNGDRTVNASDILAFRLAFLGSGPTFDYDNNGVVDAADFLQFRLRFLLTI